MVSSVEYKVMVLLDGPLVVAQGSAEARFIYKFF